MKTDIFLDTNVLLDVLLKRQPFYADAADIWNLCESGPASGYISAISFNNIFYVARKLSGKDSARDMMVLLRDMFSIVDLDAQILAQAIAANYDDFEDAIQYHSAVRASAGVLITRNVSHFPDTDIPILTPRDFLATQSGP